MSTTEAILTRKQLIKKEQEWRDRQIANNGKCARCGRKHMLTLDHIIPLQILSMMGVDTKRHWDEENNQLLCRPCNSLKGLQLDFGNPKTKILLLKYLKSL